MTSVRPVLPALTGLRYIAATYVVITHTAAFSDGWPQWARNITHSGFTGVSLFFILSGFILTYTYLADDEMRGTSGGFWVARVARIYPLYLLALVAAVPSLASNVASGATSTGEFIQAVILAPLMLQAWTPHAGLTWDAPAWSLSAEALFYLLFPFILPFVARMARRALVVTMVSAGALALLIAVGQPEILPGEPWRQLVVQFPAIRALEFLVGVGLGVGYLKHGWRISSRWAAPTGLAILVLLAMTADLMPRSIVSNALLLPFFCVLLLSLTTVESRASRVLASKAGVLLGEASYGVYLLHVPISRYYFHALERVHQGFAYSVPGVVLLIALVTGIAIATYKWVETPARRWIRGRWGEPRLATSSATPVERSVRP